MTRKGDLLDRDAAAQLGGASGEPVADADIELARVAGGYEAPAIRVPLEL